jgi:outer membrane biosynthesis protein TonB
VSGDDNRISRIRERAYLLWERGHHGTATDHWLRAEQEIDAESVAVMTRKRSPAKSTSAAVAKPPAKAKAATPEPAKPNAAKPKPAKDKPLNVKPTKTKPAKPAKKKPAKKKTKSLE